MVDTPYFSIIVPLFNCASSIQDLILSIQAQTFTDYECILVDDQSTDDTYTKAKVLAEDFRFRVLKTSHKKTRRDPAVPRNAGLCESRGKYICFLDADDRWLSKHLQFLYNASFNEGKISYLFSSYFRTNGQTTVHRKLIFPFIPVHWHLAVYNPIPLSSSCIKLSALKYYFPSHPHEDYLFWRLNLANTKLSSIHYIEKPSMIYSINPMSVSGNKLLSCLWIIQCYSFMGHKKINRILLFVGFCFIQFIYMFLDKIKRPEKPGISIAI